MNEKCKYDMAAMNWPEDALESYGILLQALTVVTYVVADITQLSK